ncbi:MAG: lytic transglycosylase domain-containing protein [Candidatus Sphingomonas phytovorans]|nr:lytic transglycosylase domain-containing protein [Sphingomonas sp.]WEK02152.1 MAG: lytic transglycosylase domain-containing protein [Sphingomonas sp.]
MAPLTRAIAAVALIASGPAHADPLARWRSYVAEASVRFGVPAVWIERVMSAESAGQTMFHGRPITSRAGAMGLMQLMPATWTAMRAQLGLGADPYNPRDNILAGAFYLRLMYDRFGYPGLFAAYNAGPGRYGDYLATGRPLPGETRAYLATVTAVRFGPAEGGNTGLFVIPPMPVPALTEAGGRMPAATSPLFVILKRP